MALCCSGAVRVFMQGHAARQDLCIRKKMDHLVAQSVSRTGREFPWYGTG